MADFIIANHGTVWNIRAVSDAAKEFAQENLTVDGWQGVPENFSTDWRAGRDLGEQLANEGFEIEVA